ncbi:hypothetical protein ACIBJF_50585 [Streptomyces sp. NPDC050743]|uniref:hypothetical protein n=1 Tax=Streptomyces sp. NPDC050743 TaxID=3365634 RepID=UPI0037B09314
MIERPELLTSAGHEAPTPAVLRFISELVAGGATTVVKPACPRCHGVTALSKLLDGQRVCRACFARHAAVPCARCGAVREPATLDAAGQPLCPNCLIRDPVNLEVCVGCGRRRPVAVRLADGVRCPSCRPKEIQECGHCGCTAPWEVSRATGQPWCERCQQRWMTCNGCGTVAQARGGSFEEPLCAKCTNPAPDFWGRCPVCQTTWQLSPRACQRCVLDQRIRGLLGNDTGTIAPELVPFHEVLTSAERPDVALAWISRPKVQDLLERIGRDERRVNHDILDDLPSGKVLAHLRSVLVATGALTPRDERLVALEKWINETVQARTDLTARRILHGYAVWHHLRRLRRRIGDQHTTQLQDINVRCHVTAADNFLTWLTAQGLALDTCRQADLERWMTDPAFTYRDESGHFVRWSV